MHSIQETSDTLVVRSGSMLPWAVKALLLWGTIGSAVDSAPWWIPGVMGSLLVAMLIVNHTFISWTTIDGQRCELSQRAWTLFGPRQYLLTRDDIVNIEVDTEYWGSNSQKQPRQSLRVVGTNLVVDVHHSNPDTAEVAKHEVKIRMMLDLPQHSTEAMALPPIGEATRTMLIDICTRFADCPGFTRWADVPETVQERLCEAWTLTDGSDEPMLYIDGGFMQSNPLGLAVGTRGLYWCNDAMLAPSRVDRMSWSDLAATTPTRDKDGDLLLGNGVQIGLGGSTKQDDVLALVESLMVLA